MLLPHNDLHYLTQQEMSILNIRPEKQSDDGVTSTNVGE